MRSRHALTFCVAAALANQVASCAVTREDVVACLDARRQSIDQDGDGQYSMNEVTALLDRLPWATRVFARSVGGARRVMVACDVDGDGFITPNEMLVAEKCLQPCGVASRIYSAVCA